MTCPGRNLALVNCWSASRRQEWANGMLLSGRARLNWSPYQSFSAPSYQESSRQSDHKFRDSRFGDEVYGATNEQFSGAYAEYALASARMMAQKPRTLSFIEAASAPIVTVTAWQMLFDYARVTAGQTALIHGAAGNVGAYAVQLAKLSGLHVVATAASIDLDYVRSLGAERVMDYRRDRYEESLTGMDVVLDTVGGDTQQRSLRVLKPDGILVSVVSPVPEATQKRYGVRAAYFYVDVTAARLNKITELFDSGKLATDVGTVLPLKEVSIAHEMLAGAPHKRGKIVLSIAA